MPGVSGQWYVVDSLGVLDGGKYGTERRALTLLTQQMKERFYEQACWYDAWKKEDAQGPYLTVEQLNLVDVDLEDMPPDSDHPPANVGGPPTPTSAQEIASSHVWEASRYLAGQEPLFSSQKAVDYPHTAQAPATPTGATPLQSATQVDTSP
jgi:hypothetical protein